MRSCVHQVIVNRRLHKSIMVTAGKVLNDRETKEQQKTNKHKSQLKETIKLRNKIQELQKRKQCKTTDSRLSPKKAGISLQSFREHKIFSPVENKRNGKNPIRCLF
ncbi:hypothetical protein CHARACLAT_010957 [Characodon lateralis]|uniref:Uncharacterized protein n=1 Tax=Characodon lateralis TaxID=208331 RepID=A0ABU7F313_9TELE|nr:hypothetical protein [Characodon lateralis]